ncbi:MAG TPA: hypothetical protein VGR12_08660 [Solirubrobacteraceae bacterium]|nr:hypothetical protein [Solirubrobacteraceae bacterium]
MDETLDELQITAERVERFRAIHEDAVRDLREKIAQARAAGYDHEQIDSRIQEARESVRRFQRLTAAGDFLGAANGNGNGTAVR